MFGLKKKFINFEIISSRNCFGKKRPRMVVVNMIIFGNALPTPTAPYHKPVSSVQAEQFEKTELIFLKEDMEFMLSFFYVILAKRFYFPGDCSYSQPFYR